VVSLPDTAALLPVSVVLAALWAATSLWVLVGRALHDRRRPSGVRPVSASARRRLLHVVHSTRRGPAARSRALARLVRAGDPQSPTLLRAAFADADDAFRAAAVALAAEADADALLLEALVAGTSSRSRIAAELEHGVERVRGRLLELAGDASPVVRYWSLTLLGRLAEPDAAVTAVALERSADFDSAVRAAAATVLARSAPPEAAPVLRRLLRDHTFFVRVHAVRALTELLGGDAAAELVALLADRNWWVRAAVRESLAGLGRAGLEASVRALRHPDPFARDGAAEVVANSTDLQALLAAAHRGDVAAAAELTELTDGELELVSAVFGEWLEAA